MELILLGIKIRPFFVYEAVPETLIKIRIKL